MRVLVTGASGHIGSAVVPELIGAGHEVVGLVRSDASAARVEQAGATAVRGELTDLDGLTRAAADAEGVIHLAYNHDLMRAGDFHGAVGTDLSATRALGEGLKGTDRPFVTTGGTFMLVMGGITDRTGTEADAMPGGPRVDAENFTVALAGEGVRSSVIRLSPTVHSDLDHHGFVPSLIEFAREAGVSGYLDDGATRWPAVGTRDAARLYRLALESAPAGTRLHGVAEEGVPFRAIAEAIGRGLGIPAAQIAADDAEAHFRFLAPFVGTDNPTSNAITRRLLGWEPTDPGLIEDIDAGHYFAPVPA